MASKHSSSNDHQDYTQWSHADLIKRVSTLETQLREQTAKCSRPASARVSPKPLPRKPKKASKPFDPSKYTTRHIALKFAYLGANYNGFEHHVNNTTPLPTVEEELWRALRKTKLIFPTFKTGQSEEEVCWDGCEYSKCGRTDRGVSAFGQVIGLRVRSSRPRAATDQVGSRDDNDNHPANGVVQDDGDGGEAEDMSGEEAAAWHHVRDELPYIQLLNRILPPDIRVVAWCPCPPPAFSARFNCKERRYRYFFTNPAYLPRPQTGKGQAGEGWLDIERMQQAAQKYVGLHDFRNLCKVDPSKQITNFQRRIFNAGIHKLGSDQEAGAFLSRPPFTSVHAAGTNLDASMHSPNLQVYYFEVCGSAFLWHQVRHMVAILFLVGQGLESPSVVDDLLDLHKTPAKPLYDMASDIPLVLWDCIFPSADRVDDQNHRSIAGAGQRGYEDALDWIYVGDQDSADSNGNNNNLLSASMQDRKYGRLSIMEDLWAIWRKRKIDEVLAGSLMNLVARQGKALGPQANSGDPIARECTARVYDGSELPRSVGAYVPIMQRGRGEVPSVLNARYAVRKGLNGSAKVDEGGDLGD